MRFFINVKYYSMLNMNAAFLIPGFSPDLTFESSTLDPLREAMRKQGVVLHGVSDAWGDYSVQDFGQLAVEQSRRCKYDGILIGHSLGALALLKVIDSAPIEHLVLCSTSALFAEDIRDNLNPVVAERIGDARVQELSDFSMLDAVALVNSLGIPTTVMFGEKERENNPFLVARSNKLADNIVNADVIEVDGAGHKIGCDPYANELARVVSDVFSN